ncbi:MAG: twin-arginine translocase TatA/TatE family subunit [Promicromonosporaceae bacterium]|nr:twin-arginine translocase TatA/TatE family subunit [Promicromonosporaceae bacterium]
MFDINGGEALIIIVLALVLIGPERLPQYAAQLARLVKRLKEFAADAKERVTEELGVDADVDWSKLDPRQYDPRRIVRDALLDDTPSARAAAAAPVAAAAAAAVPSGPAPFDADAT